MATRRVLGYQIEEETVEKLLRVKAALYKVSNKSKPEPGELRDLANRLDVIVDTVRWGIIWGEDEA